MPHTRSELARARRRERALVHGYARPQRAGVRFVEVPAALHDRSKAMIASLVLHGKHEELTGTTAHYARDATLAAQGELGPEATRSSLSIHSRANQAKHGGFATPRRRVRLADPFATPSSSTITDTSPCPAPSIESNGTPGAKLIKDLARVPEVDLELLGRLVSTLANILLRVRVLEKGPAQQGVAGDMEAVFDHVKEAVTAASEQIVDRSAEVMMKMVPGICVEIRGVAQECDRKIAALKEYIDEIQENLGRQQWGTVATKSGDDNFTVSHMDSAVSVPECTIPHVRRGPRHYKFVRPASRADVGTSDGFSYEKFANIGDSEAGSVSDWGWDSDNENELSNILHEMNCQGD
uniref:Uncharacterized protein n=1 Tax=Zooxanthella nutricula TaxID=1333877 RepID=A0A7S2NTG0_9DINO|mmetsp:Transcript_36520/g.110361  ORF Transcript_36520/g.110361 Transcript_36520/m.110361 type:complete len:352 (+) Transcript_36520:140-1195(+)